MSNSKAQALTQTKAKFLEWSQSVTYHCYPKIFTSNTRFLVRLVWLGVFVFFTCLTSYILIRNVLAYYQYSVVSSIKVVTENPAQFPVVTICDSSPFTSSHAEKLIRNLSLQLYGQDILGMASSAVITERMTVIYYAKMYANVPEYGDLNRKQLGFNLTDIVVSCQFNGIPCDLEKDFHWFYHYYNGNCFQFNSGQSMNAQQVPVKDTTLEGDSYGLVLELGPLVHQNTIPAISSKGLKVFIHNQSFLPTIFDTALSVKPGEETNIAVHKTVSSNVPKPYSDCSDLTDTGSKYELYRYIVSTLNKTYRQKDCFDLYFQKAIYEQCHCYFTGFNNLYVGSSACLNSTQYACYIGLYWDFMQNTNLYTRHYLRECPLECETIAYDFQMSSLIYPNEEIYAFYAKAMYFNATEAKYNISLSTLDAYRQYYYSINVFYERLKYTLITESPQLTTISLLSNMGGSLGMFLGYSVFSCVEVLELFIEIVCIWCAKYIYIKQ